MALHNVDSGNCIQTWKGHDSEVTKLAYGFMASNHTVLSGSRDKTVKLWSFKSETNERTFSGHTMPVSGLAVLDGQRFVSGGRDCTLRLWDLSKNSPVRVVQTNRNLVTHMTFHHENGLIAQTAEDKELKLWDQRTLTVSHRFPPVHHIQMHCEWTPDGNNVITCNNGFNGDGCEITVWDVRSMKKVRDMKGHEGSVTCISYINLQQNNLPNKRLLLSCSLDRTCRIWNIENGACLWVEEFGSTNADLLQCAFFGETNAVVGGGKGILAYMNLICKAGKPYLQVHTIQK